MTPCLCLFLSVRCETVVEVLVGTKQMLQKWKGKKVEGGDLSNFFLFLCFDSKH